MSTTDVYEVTDEYGITYAPASGGKAMTVTKGEEATDLSKAAIEFLLGNGSIVLKTEADLAKMNRTELDAAAAKAGVTEPEKLPNRDAVLAAIQATEGDEG